MTTVRLDVALVQRGLVRSRSRAAALIRHGEVEVDGRRVVRPSQPVGATEQLSLRSPDRYVSRAAHKLIGALDAAGIAVPARVLDAGASTGGFTQVLLERGAKVVYAVDVGHDQLDPSLRADPRVVVRERLNLRELTLADLDDRLVDLVVADVSFISLTLLLGPLFAALTPDGVALLMVKPQFEVGRGGLDDHGVVRSPAARERAVAQVAAAAASLGRPAFWSAPSSLPGPSGNLEHFLACATQRDVGADA